jgi:hypothetical protein
MPADITQTPVGTAALGCPAERSSAAWRSRTAEGGRPYVIFYCLIRRGIQVAPSFIYAA